MLVLLFSLSLSQVHLLAQFASDCLVDEAIGADRVIAE